jgi:hypothetical protein
MMEKNSRQLCIVMGPVMTMTEGSLTMEYVKVFFFCNKMILETSTSLLKPADETAKWCHNE